MTTLLFHLYNYNILCHAVRTYFGVMLLVALLRFYCEAM